MGVDDKYRRKIHSKFGFCYCKFLKAIEERLNHDVGKQASLIKAIDRWSSNKIWSKIFLLFVKFIPFHYAPFCLSLPSPPKRWFSILQITLVSQDVALMLILANSWCICRRSRRLQPPSTLVCWCKVLGYVSWSSRFWSFLITWLQILCLWLLASNLCENLLQ